MSVAEILVDLSQRSIDVWVEGERLRYRAAKGAVTPDLLAKLTEYKAEIMLWLQKNRAENSILALPTLEAKPEERYQPFPLTDIQQAYWIGRTSSFDLGNVACHAYTEADFTDLNVIRFNQAWQQIIERHDMLRAIVLPDGRQQVLPHVPPYQIKVLDLRGKNPEFVAALLQEARQQMSHQVSKADHWPLFELRASLLEEGDVRIHISLDLIIADAWSWRILIQELLQLYATPGLILPPLNLYFRDYVLAEERLHASEVYQRSHDYWWSRLTSLPPAPQLPLVQNTTLSSPQFVRYSARVEEQDWQSLKSLGMRAGLTPSGLLLAAFAEVLTTWSKSARFTLNLTLFNRLPLHPQVNELVGDFTSLILLEVDNSGNDPFELRARRLQQQLWNDLDHRYVSGVRILRELARVQGNVTQALMPVVFTSVLLHQQNQQSPTSHAETGKAGYGISQTPQVWLDHQVMEDAGALVFNWDAIEVLFPPGLLDEMFTAYTHLLQQLAHDEQRWQQCHIDLLPSAQLARRTTINATDAPLPQELLQTLVAVQAAQRSEQPAVISPRRTLSYGELQQAATYLAGLLRQKGAQPNHLIAIVMEKGWEQIVAALAVLEAGAAYLPIDSELPSERLHFLLQHGQVCLVLTQSWLNVHEHWPEEFEHICVDTLSIPSVPLNPLAPVQHVTDLAYVIYTSGSTGLPKGVMIDHRGAVNTLLDLNERFQVTAGDRVLALSSLSFDLSVYDIFGLLAAGGTVVIPEASAGRDPAHWLYLLRQQRITVWNTVPALMEMLLEYVMGRQESLPDALRLILLSGDWIGLHLPTHLRLVCSAPQIISLGGATEASIWSIYYPIAQVEAHWKSIPYGYPLRNQRWYILNERLENCPVWVPGQLYIGGTGLAQGYWREPEKTAASFFTLPGSDERVYRTGDLGRYLPDGSIEFLGREDFQVKLQGYRIELGEVEAALRLYTGVREAVVQLREDEPGHKRLVGYVVMDGGEEEHLQEYMRSKVPAYMVPSVIMSLPALPLTANGKVNRQALPAPSKEEGRQRNIVAPRTSVEEAMVHIWMETLGLEQVGIYDNFFGIGGDSILGIQIVARANRQGIHLLPRHLFQYQTIADLATVAGTASTIQAEQGLVTGPVPLTPIQYWFFEHDHAEPQHWNQSFLFAVRQTLQPALLEQAVDHILLHHDALRMRFTRKDAEWQQVNAAVTEQIPFSHRDLSAQSAVEQSRSIEAIATELQTSLNLSTGPLLQIALFDLGNQRPGRLLVIIHHLIIDNISWHIILKDLLEAYQQLSTGTMIRLLPKTTPFQLWAYRLTEYAQSAALQSEIAYWLALLQKPVPRLPRDYPVHAQANIEASVHTVSVSFSAEETRALLQELPEIYHAQMNDVLLTALFRTFAHWTGAYTLLLDMEGHGREELFPDLDLSSTVGWFTSIFPVLLHLDDMPEPTETLKLIKEQFRSIPNHGVGYGVLRYLRPQAAVTDKLRSAPQAELNFNYLGRFDQILPQSSAFSLASEASGPTFSPQAKRKYLLNIIGLVIEGRLQVNWIYSKNIHRHATIEQLARHFVEELQTLIRHCQSQDARGYTPSDFPRAKLDQKVLDKLITKITASTGRNSHDGR